MPDSLFRANFEVALRDRFGRSGHQFALDDLQDVLRWVGGVGDVLRARILSALIAPNSKEEVVSSCAQAIAACDSWRNLLIELFNAAEMSNSVMEVGRQVLAIHDREHPLANLSAPLGAAIAVYNALRQGDSLSIRDFRNPEGQERWLLLGLENPMDQWVLAKILPSAEFDLTMLIIDDASWLKSGQIACPAFAAVAL